MPLSLVQRKSLRDNQEDLNTAVELIKTSLGVDWTFEFDFELILSKCSDDYVQRDVGALFYKEVATYISQCIAKAAEEPLTKEAFVEANTSNKIVVVPCADDKKFNKYWGYDFNNGELRVQFRTSISNVGDLYSFPLASICPKVGVFSLLARINLKENAEKFAESFETIKDVTKMEWTYDEASLEQVYPHLDVEYQDRVGDMFQEVVSCICYNIKTRAADEMVLEALQEVCPNAKVVFKFNAKQSPYWDWKFENGSLSVSFKAFCNTNDNSSIDFEKLL